MLCAPSPIACSSQFQRKKKQSAFGKVNNKGKLNVNVAALVDADLDDVTNDGGDIVLSVAGSANSNPVKFKAMTNKSGTITLVGTGSDGRIFEGDAISNQGNVIFDSARILVKEDYFNANDATMSLKDGSSLESAGKSKTLENNGVLEAMDGDAEIQMDVKNKGHLHVGKGHLKIAPPDGKTVTQESGTTTIDDGTLEIVDSTKESAKSRCRCGRFANQRRRVER